MTESRFSMEWMLFPYILVELVHGSFTIQTNLDIDDILTYLLCAMAS